MRAWSLGAGHTDVISDNGHALNALNAKCVEYILCTERIITDAIDQTTVNWILKSHACMCLKVHAHVHTCLIIKINLLLSLTASSFQ